jgi:hypothetical protein
MSAHYSNSGQLHDGTKILKKCQVQETFMTSTFGSFEDKKGDVNTKPRINPIKLDHLRKVNYFTQSSEICYLAGTPNHLQRLDSLARELVSIF